VNIRINGTAREFDGPTTVGTLVDGEVADRRGTAVAIDGEMLPRARWDDTEITDGMRLEILGAVQGG
jgi:sulfur carrier protein